MKLKHKPTGNTVEVLYLSELYNKERREVQGRYHIGEEIMVSDQFEKSDLVFTSGEPLPSCWTSQIKN